MSRAITAEPLTRARFAPFGDVLDTDWPRHFPINEGMCERYHALGQAEAVGPGAAVILSIFRARGRALPLALTMVERHPLGSQAFMPLDPRPFLVIVSPDQGGMPGPPQAFVTAPGQGINYARNVWHGVLTPIDRDQDFLVVDRDGHGENLVEHHFDSPWEVRPPATV